MAFFKKRGGQVNAANVQITEAEAALAQSDFNVDKITEIQSKFTGGVVLLVPGRIFIREGTMWKVCRKGPKRRQFFLFNDILVYGSIVANRYSHQQVLPLAQMSVSATCHYQPAVAATFDLDKEQLDEQLDVTNAFQINHASKSFHVCALSSADKTNWLTNLQKHIDRVVVVQSGEKVTRAVWVPDAMSKECMICGQRFSAFVRKHHCRQCGQVVCSSCSPHRVDMRPADGSREAKAERICKKCFKQPKAVLRANSKSSPLQKRSSERHPGPPPAAVAAKVVANVLRSHSHGQIRRPAQPLLGGQDDDSTDTEDSDDSESEELPTKKPVDLHPTPPGDSQPTPLGADSRATPSQDSQPSPPQPTPRRNSQPKPQGNLQAAQPEESHQGTVNHGPPEEQQPTPPPRKKKQQRQQKLQQEIKQKESTQEQLEVSAVNGSEQQTAATTEQQPAVTTQQQTEQQPAVTTEQQTEQQPAITTEQQTEQQSVVTTEQQSVVTTEHQPAEQQPAVTTEQQPAVTTEQQSAVTTEQQSAVATEQQPLIAQAHKNGPEESSPKRPRHRRKHFKPEEVQAVQQGEHHSCGSEEGSKPLPEIVVGVEGTPKEQRSPVVGNSDQRPRGRRQKFKVLDSNNGV